MRQTEVEGNKIIEIYLRFICIIYAICGLPVFQRQAFVNEHKLCFQEELPSLPKNKAFVSKDSEPLNNLKDFLMRILSYFS